MGAQKGREDSESVEGYDRRERGKRARLGYLSRGPRVPSYATKQGTQSARESHVLASKFAKYSLLLNVAIKLS